MLASTLAVTATETRQFASPATVTFSKDIAPIVFEHCASCHRPGGVSFSLLSYEDVKAHATLIAQATRSRFMPPWRPEPGYGEFSGTRRLTERQIALFLEWSEGDPPMGSPAGLPPTASWSLRSQLGEPDLIVSIPKRSHYVPAATRCSGTSCCPCRCQAGVT